MHLPFFVLCTLSFTKNNSPELSRQIQELLALAPRPNDEVLFASDVSQAILVSTNLDFEAIPAVDDYSALLRPQICLNILGGTTRRLDISPGGTTTTTTTRMVSPGSLRQNGDFCWIDLGLVKDDTHDGAYRWQVQHVEFDTIQPT